MSTNNGTMTSEDFNACLGAYQDVVLFVVVDNITSETMAVPCRIVDVAVDPEVVATTDDAEDGTP